VKTISSFKALEKFGRIRLSDNFFMRDFLYSEISNFYGIPNLPDNPARAIEAGQHLCRELLEPLNATFGRIAIRSAYRSSSVNAAGNENGHNCARNEANYARHIWDIPDEDGLDWRNRVHRRSLVHGPLCRWRRLAWSCLLDS
jgi:hypothetical protein